MPAMPVSGPALLWSRAFSVFGENVLFERFVPYLTWTEHKLHGIIYCDVLCNWFERVI